MKKNLFLSFLIFHSFFSQAQRLLESDIIHGGFTMGGAISVFSGKLIKSKIQIPPGSTIKKVYFLAAEDRKKENVIPPRKVWINDTLFAHHEFTRFTGPFVSSWAPINGVTFDGSFMHVLDITHRFNYVGDTLYVNISEIIHNPLIGYFNTYTILLIFENPSLPRMAYSVFLNEQDVTHYYTFPLQFPHPVQNTRPVGFGIWGWHMCNASFDGSNIFVNNQHIGRVGGEEPNSFSWCSGVYPNFAYYNDSLFAFDGDTSDSLMAGPDATANIQAYIPHLADTLRIQSNYQTPGDNIFTNPIGGLFFAYTTPCDTFSAAVGPRFLNHLCPGDTLQLWATGGVRYEWSPAIGLSCYDCPNPVFRHDSSMAYTVRIYNNDTCSKVLPVKVNVNYPRFTYLIRPATCGLANATVIVHPLWPERFASANLSNNFLSYDTIIKYVPGSQAYQLTVTDTQGCSTTLPIFVPETIPTFAGFVTQPTEGNAPLAVNFQFTGSGATHFHWNFGDGDSLYTTQTTAQHTYSFAGTYHPYLIAWLHAPHCTDTFYQQVTVHPALHVAELITPNGDQHNDTWLIQGIESYPQLAVKVLNRWGDVVYSAQPYTNTWNGDNLPSGTYFWVVYPLGIDNTPEDEVMKGFLELRR